MFLCSSSFAFSSPCEKRGQDPVSETNHEKRRAISSRRDSHLLVLSEFVDPKQTQRTSGHTFSSYLISNSLSQHFPPDLEELEEMRKSNSPRLSDLDRHRLIPLLQLRRRLHQLLIQLEVLVLSIVESVGQGLDLLLLLLDGSLPFFSSSLEILGRSGEMTFELLQSSLESSELRLADFRTAARKEQGGDQLDASGGDRTIRGINSRLPSLLDSLRLSSEISLEVSDESFLLLKTPIETGDLLLKDWKFWLLSGELSFALSELSFGFGEGSFEVAGVSFGLGQAESKTTR